VITAVTNQKGGTGKTTTCENLGVGLAIEGKKVLLVDTDPQASLTVALGYPRPDDLPVTLSDLMAKVIQDKPIEPGEGILHHPEGVDLVPANIYVGMATARLFDSLLHSLHNGFFCNMCWNRYEHQQKSYLPSDWTSAYVRPYDAY